MAEETRRGTARRGHARRARKDPDTAFFGHPVGLGYLAFTEAWERFSFSGMQALLVLYMVQVLLRPGRAERVWGFGPLRAGLQAVYGPLAAQPLSSVVFGLYTGLVFLTPLAGGYLGDRVFRRRHVVIAGALLMAAGHLIMSLPACFLLALLLVVVGTGCLKGNISSQVGALYADDDRRRSGAFQIFNAGTDLGVLAAPLVCGTLGETLGFRYGFAAAGLGMIVSLATYLAGRASLPSERAPAVVQADSPAGPSMAQAWTPVSVGLLALAFVLTTAFLVSAGQFGDVYPLWLRAHVDRRLFGLVIPVTWFLSVTPLFSVMVTPAVLSLFDRLAERGLEPPMTLKMGMGLVLAAAALGVMGRIAGAGGPVSWLWLLPVHLLVSLAFLLVWPVGLAVFSRAAPPGGGAVSIGVFFLSGFVASNLVGWIGGFYSTMATPAFWLLQAGIAAAGAALALGLGPRLERRLAATCPDSGKDCGVRCRAGGAA